MNNEAAASNEPVAQETPEASVAEEAKAETVVAEAPTETAAQAEAKPAKAGKGKRWYIIHAYSGFEKKVAASILETAAQKGLTDAFEQVVVPTEDVIEVRRGKKVQAGRKF